MVGGPVHWQQNGQKGTFILTAAMSLPDDLTRDSADEILRNNTPFQIVKDPSHNDLFRGTPRCHYPRHPRCWFDAATMHP